MRPPRSPLVGGPALYPAPVAMQLPAPLPYGMPIGARLPYPPGVRFRSFPSISTDYAMHAPDSAPTIERSCCYGMPVCARLPYPPRVRHWKLATVKRSHVSFHLALRLLSSDTVPCFVRSGCAHAL